jgi:hypothetical protein
MRRVSAAPTKPPRVIARWRTFEGWVGSRSSAACLFLLGLAVFAVQSVALPVSPGRDMERYVHLYLQLWNYSPVLPAQINDRGPLAGLGVGVPLELGGVATELWLGVLFAASIVAWATIARSFGARAALVTSGLLLVYPGYGIVFHGLSGDPLFAAGFAGWAVALTRAIRRPSVTTFLVAGLGMGLLVLIRPVNQVLIVFALLPLFLHGPWSRRLAWTASFFIGSTAVTQGWKALADLRYGDEVTLEPSKAAIVVALLLAVFLVPPSRRRRVAWLAIPCVVAVVALIAVRGTDLQSPAEYARSFAQSPPGVVFLYRAFVMDRIVSPGNGPASRELGRVVERDLLTQEPYRSYGIDLEGFFSSGSSRMFQDLQRLGGVDHGAVTGEAIRRHRWAFTTGIARTVWALLWSSRVYRPEVAPAGEGSAGAGEEAEYVVVNGRRLPKPSEGQPIPASHFPRVILTREGQAREVWRSPVDHHLVFDDPSDERRWERFERDTVRLASRIPTRDANASLVHRMNQASNRFPPLALWLAVGLVALAVRRPRSALIALAPAAAGLVVIVGTALVAEPVAYYAAPVSPAFIMLAVVGLLGEHPRLSVRRRRHAV